MEFIDLPSGGRMPVVGYGTWQAVDEELEAALEAALEAGYRHIDTAAVYNNEHVIGKVIKKWISEGKLTRDDLFIVTKLPPTGVHKDRVEKYLTKSLENLQLEYVDLYLIHTPFTFKDNLGEVLKVGKESVMLDTTADLVTVWKAMETQFDLGRTKAIGVSNFNQGQLERVMAEARIPISNNQIEIHLYLQQNEMIEYCKQNNITVCAYSPLGTLGTSQIFTGLGLDKEVPSEMNNPDVIKIAKKYSKTSAQVLLRFLVQKGLAVIPKSTNPTRIKENFEVLDFTLSEEDVSSLEALDKGKDGRIIDFSFFKGVNKHPEYPF